MINKYFTNFARLFALLFLGILPQAFAQQQWSMGYWTGYDGDPESALVWGGITHIIHWANVHQNTNGTLTFLCSGGVSCTQSAYMTYASGIISTAHANNVKVILGLSDPNFSAAISSGLSAYVTNIMAIVNGAGYDGVDIDWEASQNWTQYASLLTSLRASLGTKTLSGTTYGENNSFWATQTTNGNADRVNFMTYDMQGGGNPYSWFNSALYSDSCNCVLSWDLDRSRIVGAGVPAGKLNMGIPFYGYLETGVNGPRKTGQIGASQVNYKAAVTNYTLSGATTDSVTHEAWVAVSGSSWLGFENAQSVTDKVNYSKTHSLGGWVIFNLSGDYLPTQTPQHPLLAAVASVMATSSYTAPSITSSSPLSAGTVGTPYSLTINASGTTPMIWAITSGTLPSGLSLNSSSSVISGTPSTAATSSFTVEASNAAGTSYKQFSLTVNPNSTGSWFKLISQNSGMCLDVTGMSTSPGVQLEQWPCTGINNQTFQFTPVQGGYKLTAQNSGLQLDVQGGSSATANGTPIIQWPYWGGTNEIWNLVPKVDGSYSLTVLSSGKCADVTGGSTSAGAKIQQWQCTGGANQEWSLVPVQ